MRLKIICLSILIILSSCKQKESIDSELFIGRYRIIDQLVPYPYLIKEKKDSIYLLNHNGDTIDKIKEKGIDSNKEIQFKNKKLKVLKKQDDNFFAFDLIDTTNFRLYKNGQPIAKYGARFEKIKASKKLNIQKIKEDIKDIIWKYEVIEDENSNPNKDLKIRQALSFENDSLTILTNYYYKNSKTYSEFEKKAYHIFQIDNASFLSFQKEDDNPQPIFQIKSFNSETIELIDFSSRDIKDISFVKDQISQEDFKELVMNTSHYSNCFDGYQGEYYFGNNVTFKKGNEFILDHINDNIPEIRLKSGYIIIHFNINCSGDIGRFGLIQMNREFKEASYSKEIIKHLINKVSELKDFPSSYSQKNWLNYKDVHAFLMFKINEGKIVDICP